MSFFQNIGWVKQLLDLYRFTCIRALPGLKSASIRMCTSAPRCVCLMQWPFSNCRELRFSSPERLWLSETGRATLTPRPSARTRTLLCSEEPWTLNSWTSRPHTSKAWSYVSSWKIHLRNIPLNGWFIKIVKLARPLFEENSNCSSSYYSIKNYTHLLHLCPQKDSRLGWVGLIWSESG